MSQTTPGASSGSGSGASSGTGTGTGTGSGYVPYRAPAEPGAPRHYESGFAVSAGAGGVSGSYEEIMAQLNRVDATAISQVQLAWKTAAEGLQHLAEVVLPGIAADLAVAWSDGASVRAQQQLQTTQATAGALARDCAAMTRSVGLAHDAAVEYTKVGNRPGTGYVHDLSVPASIAGQVIAGPAGAIAGAVAGSQVTDPRDDAAARAYLTSFMSRYDEATTVMPHQIQADIQNSGTEGGKEGWTPLGGGGAGGVAGKVAAAGVHGTGGGGGGFTGSGVSGGGSASGLAGLSDPYGASGGTSLAGAGGAGGLGGGLVTGATGAGAGLGGGLGSGLGAGGVGAGGLGSGGGGVVAGPGGLVGPGGAGRAGAAGVPGGEPVAGRGGVGAGRAGAGGAGVMAPGVGAGRGEGEQERERSTWLTEDEDVWGVPGDVPPPVITE